MHRRPGWFGLPPMALPGTGTGVGEQSSLQHIVDDVVWATARSSLGSSERRIFDRTVEGLVPTRNLAGQHPGKLHSDDI